MKSTDTIGYLYAAIITGGGIYQAYFKKNPKLLLRAGSFGAAAAIGAYETSQRPTEVTVMTVTCLLHSSQQYISHIKNKAFLPYGPFAMISMFMIVRCAYKHMFRNKRLPYAS